MSTEEAEHHGSHDDVLAFDRAAILSFPADVHDHLRQRHRKQHDTDAEFSCLSALDQNILNAEG